MKVYFLGPCEDSKSSRSNIIASAWDIDDESFTEVAVLPRIGESIIRKRTVDGPGLIELITTVVHLLFNDGEHKYLICSMIEPRKPKS